MGFEEGDGEFVSFYFPIGNHGAENLIDGDVCRGFEFLATRQRPE